MCGLKLSSTGLRFFLLNSHFLDNDDSKIGEGCQDKEEESRTPTQPVTKMSAAVTENLVNSMSRVVFYIHGACWS